MIVTVHMRPTGQLPVTCAHAHGRECESPSTRRSISSTMEGGSGSLQRCRLKKIVTDLLSGLPWLQITCPLLDNELGSAPPLRWRTSVLNGLVDRTPPRSSGRVRLGPPGAGPRTVPAHPPGGERHHSNR